MGMLHPHQRRGSWGPEVALSMVENGKPPGRKNRVITAEERAVQKNDRDKSPFVVGYSESRTSDTAPACTLRMDQDAQLLPSGVF